MTKSMPWSQLLVSTVAAVGLAAALSPARADDGGLDTWFEARQQSLSAQIAAKFPVTFRFVGTRVVPVFVSALPRVRFIAVGPEAAIAR